MVNKHVFEKNTVITCACIVGKTSMMTDLEYKKSDPVRTTNVHATDLY